MLLAQTDATTVVGLGTVCVTLLGLLGWVLREMVGQNRDATTFIKANTEILVALKTESTDGKDKLDQVLARIQEIKDAQDGRPCVLIHRPDLVEWFRQTQAQHAKG